VHFVPLIHIFPGALLGLLIVGLLHRGSLAHAEDLGLLSVDHLLLVKLA
jgi:hypothetical protein